MNPVALKERIGPLDIGIAVTVSAFGVYVMVLLAQGATIDGEFYDTSYASIPFFLMVTAPLVLRSVAPLHALGLSLGAMILHGLLFPDIFRCGPVYLIAFFAAYSAGLRLELRESLLGLALAVALCMVMAATGDGFTGIFLQPVIVMMWAAGRFVRSRKRINVALDARNAELRAARDERAKLEVAVDRARLSSELDELLRRRLADLGALAQAGAGLEGGQATGTLAEIERESRRTLEEMREIVGTLRSDDGNPAVAPAPTLAHLDALLLRAKGDGARLRVSGDPRVLPAGVELSAYRVVEHLLGALDDAPGVDVEIAFGDDTLSLTVSGPARRHGNPAPSLDRARERVQLHRGTLSASTRAGMARAVATIPMAG